MTIMHMPGWLRLWVHRADPSEARDALHTALDRRDEVTDLVQRATLHRQNNHFAERLASAWDDDDRRAKKRSRLTCARRKGDTKQ